ncbi:hypothetical protein K2173_000829 [Erythroxylum novogranatense]|uniref:RING-CH-type domain-containing protein n=1 Tax=Erythroxylum novogranatense TaxID=1862640 RepID=A0AAV8S7T7_9ROSI|nr:hypothetical protein K2173_000829 [Erythroxylum novogranatense]
MRDVVLFVDDLQSCSAISHCRICHEAEFESCKSLEAPCACSGTVKFAHRDCIQRWCDEKGNTICEICLQNYEPGYTAPSKKSKLIEAMTIRDSLDIPRTEHELENDGLVVAIVEAIPADTVYTECRSPATEGSSSCCRTMVVTFTVLLLLRHLFDTLTGGTEDYPFTLFTILILRASGILLPLYIVFRAVSALQTIGRRRYHYQDSLESDDDEDGTMTSEDDADQHLV